MTNYTVTTLADENDGGATVANPGGTGLSLREAIFLANGAASVDTIAFDGALSGTIRLTSGQLRITQGVTIDGDSRITITGDASGNDVTGAGGITDVAASGAALLADNVRLLSISSPAPVTLDGLVLTGGHTTAAYGHGGAVFSFSDLTVLNSTVAGNSTAGFYAVGGGIFGMYSVSLTNSTVSGNSTAGTAGAGGGIFANGDITLTSSTVSGNSTAGSYAGGGGIFGRGAIGLINSIVLGNNSTSTSADEIAGTLVLTSGNIVGTNVFSGATDIGDTTAAAVFASTVDIGGGVLAGVLAANGGGILTIALNASVTNPALDAAAGTPPATDSRGIGRFDNLTIANLAGIFADLGAYELTDQLAIARDDAVVAQENAILNGDVLAANPTLADTDPENLLSVFAINGVAASVGSQIALSSGALVTLNANGTFAYDPNHAFDTLPDFAASGASNTTATDSFTYVLAGGTAATVTVTIRGVDSTDSLLGTAGPDSLSGGIGNDTLSGGAGADTLAGGSGNDTYIDPAGDTIVEGLNGGTDTVLSATTFSIEPFANVERLFLTGTAVIDGTGNALANQMLGNNAINILTGRDGNDTINGGGGADTINGGSGADRLTGELQRDKIIPGADNVQDTIAYGLIGESTGQTRDVIMGLDLNNEDRIDLPGTVTAIAPALSGALSLATFNNNLVSVFNAAALPVNNAALFTPTSGDLVNPNMIYVIVDANGIAGYQANQDWVFQLENHTGALDASDFI